MIDLPILGAVSYEAILLLVIALGLVVGIERALSRVLEYMEHFDNRFGDLLIQLSDIKADFETMRARIERAGDETTAVSPKWNALRAERRFR